MKASNTIISAQEVHKSFRVGDQDIDVVKGISVDLYEGEFFIIFGPSGSGKSTLLHMLLGLERPTTGSINFLGRDMYEMNEDARSDFRKQHIGTVYQQPNWIRSIPVIDNVAIPLLLMGRNRKEALEIAREKLALFGMADWADYFPTELSAGQQQRVSLSRALVTDPDLIIADEPTGNLDYESGQHLIMTLSELANSGRTIAMVTHDLEHIGQSDRAVRLRDGVIEQEFDRKGVQGLMKDMSEHGFAAVTQKAEVGRPDLPSAKVKMDKNLKK